MSDVPKLVLVGGPDVNKRLDLMDKLEPHFQITAVGSEFGLKEQFEARGYAYHNYKLYRGFNLLSDLKSCYQLTRIFKKLKPDIVHSFDTKPNIVARVAAAMVSVPFISGTQPGLGALYTYQTPKIIRRRKLFAVLHRLACSVSNITIFQN